MKHAQVCVCVLCLYMPVRVNNTAIGWLVVGTRCKSQVRACLLQHARTQDKARQEIASQSESKQQAAKREERVRCKRAAVCRPIHGNDDDTGKLEQMRAPQSSINQAGEQTGKARTSRHARTHESLRANKRERVSEIASQCTPARQPRDIERSARALRCLHSPLHLVLALTLAPFRSSVPSAGCERTRALQKCRCQRCRLFTAIAARETR